MPRVRRSHAHVLPKQPPPTLRAGAIASLDAKDGLTWEKLEGCLIRVNIPPKPLFPPKTQSQITAIWDLARQTRAAQLASLEKAPVGPLQTPKDLSVRPAYFFARCASDVGARYAAQLTRIGLREGFRVVVEVNDIDKYSLDKTLAFYMAKVGSYCHEDDGEWAEDDGAFALDGSISVPATIGDDAWLTAALRFDRQQRLMDLSHRFNLSGMVDKYSRQRFKAALAARGNRALRENFSYVEGGNILIGKLPSGQPFGLVGRDSVAITRALLERDTGRRISQRRALLAISKDYGLDAKYLFPIEQPCDFHLDMSMVLMAPGQVILNDAREAAEKEIRWRADRALSNRPLPPAVLTVRASSVYAHARRAWKGRVRGNDGFANHIRDVAQRFATYEARAYSDLTHANLTQAGITVYRVAGRFQTTLQRANFINGECGSNARGEPYFITQGGDPRAQAYIADMYLRRIPTGLKRIYFLDADASAESMADYGGAGCRIAVQGAAQEK